MAALQCEICGGKLMGKPGGLFECEYCGVQYDTAWAKEKIQEIRGTVKVEGTVEVTGTVKVEGPIEVKGGVNSDSLIKRGQLALEDGDLQSAKKFFDNALDLDAGSGQAYLGLLMAELEVSKKEELAELEEPFDDHDNYRKVVRFSPVLAQELNGYLKTIRDRIAREEEQERLERYEAAVAYMKAAQTISEFTKAAKQLRAFPEDWDVDPMIRECERKVRELESEARNVLRPIMERSRKLSTILSAGERHTVGLRADGTVVATRYIGDQKYNFGQGNVSDWRDVEAISAGCTHTVGLRADGTVVATMYSGTYYNGECKVSGWTDIAAISAGLYHTVGLRADGTVVATECTGDQEQNYGQCNVSGWTDIVAISAGSYHTVGLRADGTVVATGSTGDRMRDHGQCCVSGWTDIVAISAGGEHTVGLKANGTVVTTGTGERHDVSSWNDIVAVSGGNQHTVGLKADGTVVAVGSNRYGQCDVSHWQDIVAISAGPGHTVGLKADGTVVATEYIGAQEYDRGQCNVSGWRLFDHVDTLEEERATSKEEMVMFVKRVQEGVCMHCGGPFKGILFKKCKNCARPKNY